MTLVEGEGWSFEVTEWWYDAFDSEYHVVGEPTWGQLEDSAHTLTGHITYYDDLGNVIDEKYLQLESDDGWTQEELELEVTDAVEYGTPQSQTG